ncbi:hypothetical protein [Sphingobium yanoikuyae]|uniref:Uncharacterized protein n=1 Tax=Sphingobium yanoikuyae TaxID=13690 RepID=A0A3G2UV41_SPHYA|nr:hypothetical protein [Sphingobium yanoikuyae]AYO76431.1 hypothetical protein EBF16_05420 [Sphingobium yanoikuyae]
MIPAENDRVRYRVLQNPVTAPDKDYTALAMVLGVKASGLVDLVVFPKSEGVDPFQIADVPFRDDRDPDSQTFCVWEPLEDME